MRGRDFSPANSQQAASLGIAPFQRVEIMLGSPVAGAVPDRSAGQQFPALEGYGFYVERSDFPVIISINGAENSILRAEYAREGAQFVGLFKGLTITHPALNVAMALSLILFKTPAADHTNTLFDPNGTRLAPAYRNFQNNANSQIQNLYIPPGSRCVEGLQAIVGATTVTSANVTFIDVNGAIINGPTTIQQTVAGVLQSYANASGFPSFVTAPIAGPAGTFTVIMPSIIPIPTAAVEASFSIGGTVMTAMFPWCYFS